MKRFLARSAAALLALAGAVRAAETEERPPAAALLEACREGLPLDHTTLSGRLIVRKPRGFVESENQFTLSIDWGAEPASAVCVLYDAKGETLVERVELTRPHEGDASIKRFTGDPLEEQEPPSLASRVAGTDLLWLDLTLDFLWWPDAVYDDGRNIDRRVRGRACEVVRVAPPKPVPGLGAVRMWIDKKTGLLMKAAQLAPDGKTIRYFWVQKVKQFEPEDRWMIRLLEADSQDGLLRTQLLVDALNDEVLEPLDEKDLR
ncbi:MAG: hypothetical protein FWF96_07670 [Kiritimatiellaeota bacterium]|nr:hypothetical protein [Kiritimatiellota bacterium]